MLVPEWLCVCAQYKHQLEETKKEKRTRIPYKTNYSLNLWSIMKNCIGKELSKIPMPVRVWPIGAAARGPLRPGGAAGTATLPPRPVAACGVTGVIRTITE